MILVDTSVWIEHLRSGQRDLRTLLDDGRAACHPFVIGELACGTLARRAEVLDLMAHLPSVEPIDHEEALRFVDARRLGGSGLGWVDVHLLGAALVSGVGFLTLDRRLAETARRLHLNAKVV